jgi:hypothetical protein
MIERIVLGAFRSENGYKIARIGLMLVQASLASNIESISGITEVSHPILEFKSLPGYLYTLLKER